MVGVAETGHIADDCGWVVETQGGKGVLRMAEIRHRGRRQRESKRDLPLRACKRLVVFGTS